MSSDFSIVSSPASAPVFAPLVSSLSASKFVPGTLFLLSGAAGSGKHSLLSALKYQLETQNFSRYQVADIATNKPHTAGHELNQQQNSKPIEIVLSQEEFQSQSTKFIYSFTHPLLKSSYGISFDSVFQSLSEGISVILLVPLTHLSAAEKFLAAEFKSKFQIKLIWLQTLSNDQIVQRLSREESAAVLSPTSAESKSSKSAPPVKSLAAKRAKLNTEDKLLAGINFNGSPLPSMFASQPASPSNEISNSVVSIWNGGSLVEAVNEIIDLLTIHNNSNNDDSRDSSSADSANSAAAASASTFPPVPDYLISSIYPYLYPALNQLEILRPADPIEFLALELLRNWQTDKERIEKIKQFELARRELREGTKKEYEVQGRV